MKKSKSKFGKMSFGKKGMGIAIAVVIIAASLIFEAFLVTNMVANTNVARRTTRETASIETINAMDFLKRSMQEAVKHAAYRASYDILSRGGYYSIPDGVSSLNCEPYWRKYSETFEPDKATVQQSLENATRDVFGCYGKIYSTAYSKTGISINTPSYSTCGNADITDEGGNKFSVNIKNDCDSGLEVSRDFISVKESNANFEDEVKLNVFELIERAKSKFIDGRPVRNAIQAATSNMACKRLAVEELECSYEGMEDTEAGDALIALQCSEWRSKLKKSIDVELAKIKIKDADVSFSFSDNDMNAKYKVTGCTICEAVTYETNECVNPPKCGNGICEEGESDLSCPEDCAPGEEPEECEKKTITKYRTNCSYDYSADANVVVVVKAKEDMDGVYYPIYNSNSGNVEWKRFALRFHILDGNLGTLNAKTDSCPKINYC